MDSAIIVAVSLGIIALSAVILIFDIKRQAKGGCTGNCQNCCRGCKKEIFKNETCNK